jgi:hypothetical protein
MKNLSATTVNFAKSRNLAVYEFLMDDAMLISIHDLDQNSDAELNYYFNDNGTFTFMTNTYLDISMLEEIPAFIRDEKHLREVIDFIYKSIN